ncbi:large subunit ribosomal protein L3 [Ereboglobus sp. PH5-5]|uniref:50S ribosomal protein L3 n=1 Tax=unclassified Ereboglobus TaxID=2626932 RepID=UPI0024060A45|nr:MULTISPECIES: 50S ribosomal protein L3 [unclassified Ereboglobus]MDF9826319.1 large subunit ribosomal protein L3 [Ereboglobus sp. PH5-10]MDF9833907.1 large subunit ribosomal protein L3 [Ereboglobus sp. PH5-5]
MITTLLGKKLGMTQVYDAQNVLVPVTVVEAGPCPVVQVKTTETDGYNAVQLGFNQKKAKNASKAEAAHAKKAGLEETPRVLSEIRLDAAPELKVGDIVKVDIFKEGQIIDVIGITKGKGFQGVVRRFRVAGGVSSHGSMFHRRIGSVGMRQTPGRVWKNQKMPGHMGNVRRTVQNLTVVKIIAEKNLILVKGAIPGANGDDVIVRTAIKGQPRAAAK